MKNAIGLDSDLAYQLAEKLNDLLANYQVFYTNVRAYHWNIQGDKFFELHLKFEELYNDLQMKIDEVAERILTLGHVPVHSFSNYLKSAQIRECTIVNDSKVAIDEILSSFDTILPLQRDILKLADMANDEGTNSLMSDYIRQQEKLVWMYTAYSK